MSGLKHYFSSVSVENTTFHLYYAFILNYLIGNYIWHRITDPIMVPVDPHFVISWIPSELYILTIKFFSVTAVVSVSILIFYPWARTLKILALIGWIIYFAHESSFGKSNNDHYASTFSMLTLIFLPTDPGNRKKIDQVLFIAKFQAVMCYAMAGLWKVRVIPLLWEDGGMWSNLGNAIAMEYMKYGRAPHISDLSLFFLNRDYLTAPMFYGLVLIQTFSPLLIVNRKLQIVFGLMIVLFHVLSELILNINFRNNMFVMMVLFLYDPIMRELRDYKETKKKGHLSAALQD